MRLFPGRHQYFGRPSAGACWQKWLGSRRLCNRSCCRSSGVVPRPCRCGIQIGCGRHPSVMFLAADARQPLLQGSATPARSKVHQRTTNTVWVSTAIFPNPIYRSGHGVAFVPYQVLPCWRKAILFEREGAYGIMQVCHPNGIRSLKAKGKNQNAISPISLFTAWPASHVGRRFVSTTSPARAALEILHHNLNLSFKKAEETTAAPKAGPPNPAGNRRTHWVFHKHHRQRLIKRGYQIHALVL